MFNLITLRLEHHEHDAGLDLITSIEQMVWSICKDHKVCKELKYTLHDYGRDDLSLSVISIEVQTLENGQENLVQEGFIGISLLEKSRADL